MDVSKLALIILRVLQLIFSVILLAVCADASEFLNGSRVQNALDRNNNIMLYGLIPQIQFGAFVGAWGLLTSLVGMVAAFIEAIPWIAQMVLDGLALLFFFADAVALAVWLSRHNISTAGGSRESEIRAADAFLWLGFLVTLALLPLIFLARRK